MAEPDTTDPGHPAKRGEQAGVIRITDGGATIYFYPGDGSERFYVRKRDNEVTWDTTCWDCGCVVRNVTSGSLDVTGRSCSGCLGYPHCSCKVTHTGECP
jgi:hypothetical protein